MTLEDTRLSQQVVFRSAIDTDNQVLISNDPFWLERAAPSMVNKGKPP